MSAPTSHDPLVVNTKDGAVWLRRAVTQDGRGLYAVDGSCRCPEYLMATLVDLAEHGIAGSADVLPVPVGPEPLEDRERVELLTAFKRALAPFCGDPMAAAAAVAAARDAEVEWLLADAQRLQDRVTELELTVQQIRFLHKDSPMGPCPVCVDADAMGRGEDPTIPYPCPTARLAGAKDCDPPSVEVSTDRLTRFFAPTQAYREDEAAEGTAEAGQHVEWCTGCNTDHDPDQCGYRPETGGAS